MNDDPILMLEMYMSFEESSNNEAASPEQRAAARDEMRFYRRQLAHYLRIPYVYVEDAGRSWLARNRIKPRLPQEVA